MSANGHRMDLRKRLIIWTSAALAASIFALVVTVAWVASRAMTALANEALSHVALKTAEELDLWIGARERDALNLAPLEVFASACKGERLEDAQRRLLEIHKRSPFYENVFLAHADGKLFMDSIDGKSIGVDIRAIDGYRPNAEHGALKEVWTGEVMKSPASGRPVALVTAPVIAAGEVVGLLGTPIELSRFSQDFVSAYRIGKSGHAYVLDGAGVVLAHRNAAKVLNDDLGKRDFGGFILNQPAGSLTYDEEGARQAAQFRRAKMKPWTVVAAMPEEEFQASSRDIRVYAFGLGLAALASTLR